MLLHPATVPLVLRRGTGSEVLMVYQRQLIYGGGGGYRAWVEVAGLRPYVPRPEDDLVAVADVFAVHPVTEKDTAELAMTIRSFSHRMDPFGLVRRFDDRGPVPGSDWYFLFLSLPKLMAVLAAPFGFFLIRLMVRARRRRWRIARGLCVACGYDLSGNVSGICPECSQSVDKRV